MEMMLANNGNKQQAILLLVTVVYYTCTHGSIKNKNRVNYYCLGLITIAANIQFLIVSFICFCAIPLEVKASFVSVSGEISLSSTTKSTTHINL